MIRKIIVPVFLLSALCVWSFADEEYSLADFINDLEKADYLIQKSASDLRIAEQTAKELLKDRYPQLSVDLGGVIGEMLDTNISNGGILAYQGINAGVNIHQLLPTGGTLSLSAGNMMQFGQLDFNDEINNYTWQYPQIGAGLSQPLFVNNRIIDFDLYRQRFRTIQKSIVMQESKHKLDCNTAVFDATSVFFREIMLRKQIAQLEQFIALNEKQVSADRLFFEQGRMSYSDLRESELELETLKKNLVEAEYARLVNYHTLLLKLERDSDTELNCSNDDFPDLITINEQELLDILMSDNCSVHISEYMLEARKNDAIQNGLKSASFLNIDFYLKPRYEYGNLPENFGDSVDDHFDDEAGIDWRLGMSISIPLDELSKGRNRKKVDAEKIRQAEMDLRKTRQEVINNFVQLFENRKFLTRRISLVIGNIGIEEKRLAETEQLLALEMVTPLDLDGVRIELLKKKNELWEIRSLMFLNDLTILSLCGNDIGMILKGETE
ncbi:MAG: TolC family protein [Spirochaetales bacterium]|nr:TolC family protein [Spirochaetales bacterium]